MKTVIVITCCLILTITGCQTAPPSAAALPEPIGVAKATSCNCGLTGSVVFPYQKTAEFTKIELGQPAGLVFHPGRKSLFVAGAQGQLVELDPTGRLVRRKQVQQGVDFVGVAYNPTTDLLYLALAKQARLLVVNPVELAIRREINLDFTFENTVLIEPGNSQIESLTFAPDPNRAGGSFYLANKSGAVTALILELVIEAETTARVARVFTLNVANLSDIYYDPIRQELLVINDSNSLLQRFSLTGERLEAVALPGQQQKVIAFDDQGFLYIGESSGHVIKYQPVAGGS